MRFKVLSTIVVGVVAALAGCGGGSSQPSASQTPLVSNWQWALYDASGTTPPAQGGITGGFLQQKGNSITGTLAYATYINANGNKTACAGGSAPVTGSVNGQSVTLTAVAGGQTYKFQGTLATAANGSTMTGTYTSTDGSALTDGGGTCGTGTGQQSLNWNAVSVPPLTGAFQGSFHSIEPAGQGQSLQDFAVTGTLIQAENTSAGYASVTGTIQFAGYPCLSQAGLNGTISGSSVILGIIGPNGLAAGSIGQNSPGGGPPIPATLKLGTTSNLLLSIRNTSGGGYQVTTGSCPGDVGNVCLGLGTAADCNVPITFSPATLTFPPQVLGTTPSIQAITLTNTDPLGQSQTLKLALQTPLYGLGGYLPQGVGDFNSQPHYTEQDTCRSSPFTLAANQSCTINVSFSPQEGCTWDAAATPPPQCPITLPTYVVVTTASSPVDGSNAFAVPVTGTGLSALVASPQELDFGQEDPNAGEQSDPQTVSFTNQAPYPVQILPSASCGSYVNSSVLPDPLVPGAASGLQVVVVEGFNSLRPLNLCDAPPPNSDFPFVVDNCSGLTLQPQQVCTVSIAYHPHNSSLIAAGSPWLELNTLQCVSPNLPSATNPCEIDAGRFPVVLTRVGHSDSLRMNVAGLTFATQAVGTTSAAQTITLTNDPNDSKPAPVMFSTVVANGDYAQTNTCGAGLAVGQSCTITITFTPAKTGLREGTVVIPSPSAAGDRTIYLRGRGN